MKKTVSKLRKNHRMQEIHGRNDALNISFEHGMNCPECGHCGAMLPHNVKFQKAHMNDAIAMKQDAEDGR